jgi:DNA-binding CsgD family transcriptional regulator
MTNREIARTLYLSVKTVEMHLGRAYRKLDITTRAQLPAALVRRSGALTPARVEDPPPVARQR